MHTHVYIIKLQKTQQTGNSGYLGEDKEKCSSFTLHFVHFFIILLLLNLYGFHTGLSNLLASLGHTGRRVVLGHTLNTLQHILTNQIS